MNSSISKNTTNGTRSGASRSHPSAALLPGIRLRRGLALIAALMLGVLENLVSFMVPNGTALVEMAAYGTMIFVLLIRPRGLFGKEVAA